MLGERASLSEIHRVIRNEGYAGSYSLLQQHCHPLKPVMRREKKNTRFIARRDVSAAIWKEAALPENEVKRNGDMEHIRSKYPEYDEIGKTIREFRVSYSGKDIEAVERWVNSYPDCKYQSIVSFINGIKKDAAAFYNSLRYEYSNGLLEGCVNKLKEIKRTMFGRASYKLLRAKMLLNNKSVSQR